MVSDETIVASMDSLELGSDQKKPFISFMKGPRMGEIHPLEKAEIVVGRSKDCDLWIADSSISRQHFKLFVRGEVVTMRDLGSTNGTYINGKKLPEAKLSDGDRIQISKDTIMELTYLDESRSQTDKKIYEMGVKDAVTGIYNKRYFLDRLREEFAFAHRRNGQLSLIILDIDFFKKINDTRGHLAGDYVLKAMSEELGRAIRSNDVFARYGGEEFTVIMRDTGIQPALELAERMRSLVEKTIFSFEEKIIPVTISLGVTAYHDGMKDAVDLIAEADKLLYLSKQGGRNRVTGPGH